MEKTEYVILVDEQDRELGVMEKQEAHRKAMLHRAFSVFIFNTKGELLLQQRAFDKYHSGRLWTNTCCSHPRPNESTVEAAHRRLQEEMGFDCLLIEKFHFIYHAPMTNGLSEHELDFIYTGIFDKEPVINPKEVASYKWMDLLTLTREVEAFPEQYTVWFRIILKEYLQHL